jgi:tetratricopeptide (TPR) repeat protein
MRYLFVITLLILVPIRHLKSQNQDRTIDSLLILVRNAKDDTLKVNRLNLLCKKHRELGDYQRALNFTEQAKNLAVKLNYKKGVAYSYDRKGVIAGDLGNSIEAIENHLKSIEISKEINDLQAIASTYNNISVIYAQTGNYSEALKNSFASLVIGP